VVTAGGGTMVKYCISSDSAVDTSDKWAGFIRKARSKESTKQQQLPSSFVLLGLEGEVLRNNEDWVRVYVEGAKEYVLFYCVSLLYYPVSDQLTLYSMNMRIIFEEDLALAVLHADLSYIDCSLDHELPQKQQPPTQHKSDAISHANSAQAGLSRPSIANLKVVRSTLEEESFDPTVPTPPKTSADALKEPLKETEPEPELLPLVCWSFASACGVN
jgi:hypothetical protein